MTSGHHPTSRSPGDQAGHPDLDALADLDAGLVDPATETTLTEHVRSCPVCAGTLRALATVRSDLRALPPPRLPDSVAARLDATLAGLRGEASRSSAGPAPAGGASPPAGVGSAGGGGSGDSHPGPSAQPPHDVDELAAARERRRERIRRTTTLAAASVIAVAALVGTGTAVLRQTQDHNSNNAESAAVPADSRSISPSVGGSRGDAPAAGAGPENRTKEPAPTTALASYTRLTLAPALPRIEKESTVVRITAAGPTGPGGVMAETGRRTSCSRSILGATGQPAAVQRIVFEGTPAFVFVYRDAGLGRRAFVVAEDCGLRGTADVRYSTSG